VIEKEDTKVFHNKKSKKEKLVASLSLFSKTDFNNMQ
jgi:hypothetical protein